MQRHVYKDNLRKGCFKISFDLSKCSPAGRFFVILAMVQALIIVTCQVIILAVEDFDWQENPVPGQAAPSPTSNSANEEDLASGSSAESVTLIYIFGLIYQLIYALDAVHTLNSFQLIGFLAQMMMFILNSAPQTYNYFGVVEEKVNDYVRVCSAVSLVTLSVCTLIYFYLVVRLWGEFHFRMYVNIGADAKLRKRFRIFQVYMVILKLEFYWVSVYLLQQSAFVLSGEKDVTERIISSVSIGVVFVVFAAAFFGVRWENRVCMWMFHTLSVLGISYFSWKCYIYRCNTSGCSNVSFSSGFNDQLLTTIVCLVVVVVSTGLGIVVHRNFGTGLKPIITDERDLVQEEKERRIRELLALRMQPSDYGFKSAADTLPDPSGLEEDTFALADKRRQQAKEASIAARAASTSAAAAATAAAAAAVASTASTDGGDVEATDAHALAAAAPTVPGSDSAAYAQPQEQQQHLHPQEQPSTASSPLPRRPQKGGDRYGGDEVACAGGGGTLGGNDAAARAAERPLPRRVNSEQVAAVLRAASLLSDSEESDGDSHDGGGGGIPSDSVPVPGSGGFARLAADQAIPSFRSPINVTKVALSPAVVAKSIESLPLSFNGVDDDGFFYGQHRAVLATAAASAAGEVPTPSDSFDSDLRSNGRRASSSAESSSVSRLSDNYSEFDDETPRAPAPVARPSRPKLPKGKSVLSMV